LLLPTIGNASDQGQRLSYTDSALIKAINQFSFDVFNEIVSETEPDSNIFISPLSISIALSIACNGASGETYKEFAKVLNFNNMPLKSINESYEGLFDLLSRSDSLVDFQTANSLWFRSDKGMKSGFLKTCETYYNASVKKFKQGDNSVADSINNWVRKNTEGKITKIIRPPINPDVALILLNAIYFDAEWTFKFDPEKTAAVPFYLNSGDSVESKMMFKNAERHVTNVRDRFGSIDSRLKYYEEYGVLQAIELPYGSKGFRITLILPDSSITADSIVRILNDENWNVWKGKLSTGRFSFGLPRFKFSFGISLKDALLKLGLIRAFSLDRADFSNMFEDKLGCIGKVIHKAFVKVDETGTEAAAATMIMFPDSLSPHVIFNRPFLFIIHDVDTNAILFLGKVSNPDWSD
jgi:serpin B